MATITKVTPEAPEGEQVYAESITSKQNFTISELVREIEIYTNRKKSVEAKIAQLEKKKEDALLIK